jgi:hypothetical protein
MKHVYGLKIKSVIILCFCNRFQDLQIANRKVLKSVSVILEIH